MESSRPRLALRAVREDLARWREHGVRAPRWGQRVWVDPLHVQYVYSTFKPTQHSGAVIAGDWDRTRRPVDANPIAAAAIRHFVHGETWEESGALAIHLERLETLGATGRDVDGCFTPDDVHERLRRLDALYEQVRKERRLRLRRECSDHTIREHGGVYVHIARDGRPVFGSRGVHRLVIAQAVGLPRIPAHLGVLHPDALASWREVYVRGQRSQASAPRRGQEATSERQGPEPPNSVE